MNELLTPNYIAPVSQSLYDLEGNLQALLDTEAFVSDDQRTIFNAELEHAIATTVAKRDRCGEFLKHCEAQAEFAKAESDRLRKRAEVFTHAAERMRGYIRNVIQVLGQDAKGKFKRLEGEKFTFSLRKGIESVHIDPAADVPEDFRNVTITLPATAIQTLLAMTNDDYLPGTPEYEMASVLHRAIANGSVAPDKRGLKEALQAGEQFEGITLHRGEESVVLA
jgi:hypothetical protein